MSWECWKLQHSQKWIYLASFTISPKGFHSNNQHFRPGPWRRLSFYSFTQLIKSLASHNFCYQVAALALCLLQAGAKVEVRITEKHKEFFYPHHWPTKPAIIHNSLRAANRFQETKKYTDVAIVIGMTTHPLSGAALKLECLTQSCSCMIFGATTVWVLT